MQIGVRRRLEFASGVSFGHMTIFPVVASLVGFDILSANKRPRLVGSSSTITDSACNSSSQHHCCV